MIRLPGRPRPVGIWRSLRRGRFWAGDVAENVEAFKRGLEARNRGDVETLLAVLDPEVEWHSALYALLGGEQTVFRGTTASARCSETFTRPSTSSTSRSR